MWLGFLAGMASVLELNLNLFTHVEHVILRRLLNLTEHFVTFEPQNQEIDNSFGILGTRSSDFEALK